MNRFIRRCRQRSGGFPTAVGFVAAMLWPVSTAGGARAGTGPARLELSPRFVPGNLSCGRMAEFEVEFSPTPDWDAPYSRRDADLAVTFTGPSGETQEIPAFFAQPFLHAIRIRGGKQRLWVYPSGVPRWLVRWTPESPGVFSAVARWRRRDGRVDESPVLKLTATPSNDARWHGFVRLSPRDPRFLEFTDGTPFFPVGQNFAFVKNVLQTEQMLARFGKAGGNFARIWVCCEDWALAVEARKSAWGRSWDWHPPIVRQPGRTGYSSERHCLLVGDKDGAGLRFEPCNPVAVRAGAPYVLRGEVRTEGKAGLRLRLAGLAADSPVAGKTGRWTPFSRHWTAGPKQWWLPGFSLQVEGRGRVWLRNLSLKEKGGGPERLSEADPDRPARGVYNQVDCFLLDRLVDAAVRSGVFLQLCLLTRDHYSPDLTKPGSAAYHRAENDAENLLRYAVARWGACPNVAVWEYFNEANPGLPNHVFYEHLGAWLERHDPWRHPRTTSAWSPCPPDWKHPRLDIAEEHFYLRPATGPLFKDAVAAVLDRARLLRRHVPGKPALIAEFGVLENNWQPTPLLAEDPQFLHLHNALWTSLLSGLSGTVMHWFWQDIEDHDLYPLYTPVAAFAHRLPWTTARLHPLADVDCPAGLETVSLAGPDTLAVWIHDRNSTWYRVGVEGVRLHPWRKEEIRVPHMSPGRWAVRWFDTRTGSRLAQATTTVTAAGVLLLRPPPFTGDVAGIAKRKEANPAARPAPPPDEPPPAAPSGPGGAAGPVAGTGETLSLPVGVRHSGRTSRRGPAGERCRARACEPERV